MASKFGSSRQHFVAAWRLGLLLLALTACEERLPPIPGPHPEHDLVIEGGLPKYNGKPLPLGARTDEWISVLGMPERVQGQLVFWDTLGLGARVDGTFKDVRQVPGKRVECLELSFKLDGREYEAKHVFPGRVLLEGAPVYEGASLNSIDRRLRVKCRWGNGFTEDALPNIYSCDTVEPAIYYGLGVYVLDHTTLPRRLEMCPSLD